MPKAACLLLVACAAFSAGCGGGNRETLEKKMSGLQDEVTRLQNTNDRLAERVQALEITSMRGAPQAAAAAAAAPVPEESRVARPNLKVVKMGPGTAAPAAEPEPEPEPAEDDGPRPVIKDHGTPPAGGAKWVRPAAWGKPQAPRAGGPPMGQNAGARRPTPQGT